MSKSRLLWSLALGSTLLVGCKEESKTGPNTTPPEGPTTTPSSDQAAANVNAATQQAAGAASDLKDAASNTIGAATREAAPALPRIRMGTDATTRPSMDA